jgi:hypothetical protein
MNFESPVVWILLAILVALTIGWTVRHFSEEARRERRRRRSNAPIVSKGKRPTVKFSVRTPRSKR